MRVSIPTRELTLMGLSLVENSLVHACSGCLICLRTGGGTAVDICLKPSVISSSELRRLIYFVAALRLERKLRENLVRVFSWLSISAQDDVLYCFGIRVGDVAPAALHAVGNIDTCRKA